MTEEPGLNLEFWRSRMKELQADKDSLARFAKTDRHRRTTVPEMLGLLERYRAGTTDLEGFRSEYDVKTRTEWDMFGLKGLSGAMFLNKLVKHLPDQEELSALLRDTLELPSSPADGEARLRAFDNYLESKIEVDLVTRAQIQPSRAPFFLSAWWHLQALEEWPIYYKSARKVLEKNTTYQASKQVVEAYFDFRELYLRIARELGLSNWELEHLLAWIDLRDQPTPPPPDPIGPDERKKVWLVAPGSNADHWEEFYEQGIIAIGWDYLGDLGNYKTLDELKAAISKHRDSEAEPVNDAMACYQFVHEMKKGDVIYAKKGRVKIVGRGTIASDYFFDRSRKALKQVRRVKWDKRGEWVPRERPLVTKTLTEIGRYPGLVRDIGAALGSELPPSPPRRPYDLDQAAAEIFLSRTEIEDLLSLLQRRKNVVLQGPPGTGKSFIASRLARLALGGEDPERLATVQFHQSYAYEDFVQGYRPTESGGFERRDGPFMRFCNLALQDQENSYVLIVDEINRGNLSKILGELMMLIEPDKRDARWATHLAYSAEDDEPFYVPSNLLIIGTMNTADRSLALVDYALRRRFAFVDIEPAFGNALFQDQLAAHGADASLRDQILSRMTELNRQIAADKNLGRGFMIGHSYFCQYDGEQPLGEEWLERIIVTEIAPLLREYWFDAEEKAKQVTGELLENT